MTDKGYTFSGEAYSDIRGLFDISFRTLNLSEKYSLVYKNDPSGIMAKKLLKLYIKYINPDYNSMIYSFKRKYVSNEVRIEKNDTKEQREGLNLVYDYIQNYDCRNGLDIFIVTLEMHRLLWKPTDDKNNVEIDKERDLIREKINRLNVEVHDLSVPSSIRLPKYREAKKLEKELSNMQYKSKIGGLLRSSNSEDEVHLRDYDIDIPSARESLEYMNSFISPEKKEEFLKYLNNNDIIDYISYCVKEICDLIYYQPFIDGNKRVFRSLLNLMFKVKGLPPVYIRTTERDDYKKALYKAIKSKDYDSIITFYLYKICDSIYELDVLPYFSKNNNTDNKKSLS